MLCISPIPYREPGLHDRQSSSTTSGTDTATNIQFTICTAQLYVKDSMAGLFLESFTYLVAKYITQSRLV